MGSRSRDGRLVVRLSARHALVIAGLVGDLPGLYGASDAIFARRSADARQTCNLASASATEAVPVVTAAASSSLGWLVSIIRLPLFALGYVAGAAVSLIGTVIYLALAFWPVGLLWLVIRHIPALHPQLPLEPLVEIAPDRFRLDSAAGQVTESRSAAVQAMASGAGGGERIGAAATSEFTPDEARLAEFRAQFSASNSPRVSI